MSPTTASGDDAGTTPGDAELTPDALQLAFHEVECATYDERFAIVYDHDTARSAADEVRALVGRRRFARVLDVGCGTGYLGLGLAAAGLVDEVHLTDLSPGMLARAADNAAGLGVRAELVRATATALPYPDATFDAVVSRGVLHHLHDVPAALGEWRRVVRPGGPVIALSEPTAWADRIGGPSARAALAGLRIARRAARVVGRALSEHDEDAAQEHRYWDLVAMAANLHTFTPASLAQLGRDAGFARVRVRGSGFVSITWAAAHYVLVGELPRLAASERAKRIAARVWRALRRVDRAVVEPLVPGAGLLTVQAVFRDPVADTAVS